MQCVRARKPPIDIAPEVDPPEYDRLIRRDMTGNNEYAQLAATWLKTRPIHKEHEDVKEALKAMLKDDERELYGYGVTVLRGRNKGFLYVRETATFKQPRE